MQKIIFICGLLLLVVISHSQNTFPSSGNAGIGTSTPSLPLSIATSSATTVGFYRSFSGGSANVGSALGQNVFGVYNSTNGAELTGGLVRGIATQAWTAGSAQGTGLAFSVTANSTATLTEAMRIDHNGRLGIGTSTPSTALQIGNTSGNNFITLAGGSTGSSYGINYAFSNPGSNIYAQTMLDWDTRATRGLQFNSQSGYGFSFNTIDNTGAYQSNLVTITGAGKVGINATSPVSTLEVNSGTANTPAGLVLNQGTASGNGNSSRLFFANSGDITTNSFSIFKNVNNLTFSYGANPGSSSGTFAMVLRNDGNIGIGTNAPNAKLDVSGTFFSGGSAANLDPTIGTPISLSPLSSSGKMLIGWNRSGGGGETDFITNQGSGDKGGYSFYQYSNSGTLTNLMSINGATGNVWIASPNTLPSFSDIYKLNVNGDVRANRLYVNTTGADFVFEPNYTLIPLSQLEKYVTTNHHLPGIETANTMQKDGVDVGGNQTKLLQKIEELTLYVIAQDKQQKQTTTENAELVKTVNGQKELLQKQQELLDQLRKEVDYLKAAKK